MDKQKMNSQERKEWKDWLKNMPKGRKKQRWELYKQKVEHPDPMKELIKPKEKKENWKEPNQPKSIKDILGVK